MSEFADTDPLGAWLAGDWPPRSEDHPPCCGPTCEGSSCWDCRGTGHPHAPTPARSEARCWLDAGCIRGYHGVMDEDGCQYGALAGSGAPAGVEVAPGAADDVEGAQIGESAFLMALLADQRIRWNERHGDER